MAETELVRKQLLDRIEELIEEQDFVELKQLLSTSRSSDVAEVVEVVDEIARQILFDLLDPDDAGEVLEKIDEATRSQVVEDLSTEDLQEIVVTLPPDEAADVMSELSEQRSEEILENIPKDESDQIEKLLKYEEDSAGGLMNPELVKVNVGDTVSDAIHAFRQADPDEDFYYVWVVDETDQLVGAVGLDMLLRHPRRTKIEELIEEDYHRVDLGTDQEEIANTFRRNDLIAMAVVDEQNKLLGRITVDDIVDVMDEEAEEDALRMAGTHPDELDTPHILKAAKVRLPWLMSCMIGSMIIIPFIYATYEHLFSILIWNSILMFVPAIAAMGGNSGLQTSTIVVRGLATGDLAAMKIGQVFMREMRIAFVIACVCGIGAGGVSALVLHLRAEKAATEIKAAEVDGVDAESEGIVNKEDNSVSEQGVLVEDPADRMADADMPGKTVIILGISVGLAMFCGILLASTVGLLLPFAFKGIGIDPAISSGPFVTTANDSIGCLTYFTVALLLIQHFGG